MVCTFGTIPVCLVHLVSLVDLVYLVGLVQPNKINQITVLFFWRNFSASCYVRGFGLCGLDGD